MTIPIPVIVSVCRIHRYTTKYQFSKPYEITNTSESVIGSFISSMDIAEYFSICVYLSEYNETFHLVTKLLSVKQTP